jgi:hypothetical protein
MFYVKHCAAPRADDHETVGVCFGFLMLEQKMRRLSLASVGVMVVINRLKFATSSCHGTLKDFFPEITGNHYFSQRASPTSQ